MTEPSNFLLPVLGGLVQVSFFDGNHKVHNAFAHVVSVGGIAEPGEMPRITVVYPKQPVIDVRNLSGPDWFKAFERQAGVPHVTSVEVRERLSSIAYVALYGSDPQLDDLLDGPEGDPAEMQKDGQYRQLHPEALKPSPEAAIAVQSGLVPTPTAQSPLVNDFLVAEVQPHGSPARTYNSRPAALLSDPPPMPTEEQGMKANDPGANMQAPETTNEPPSTT
jgi:hypothetical protein